MIKILTVTGPDDEGIQNITLIASEEGLRWMTAMIGSWERLQTSAVMPYEEAQRLGFDAAVHRSAEPLGVAPSPDAVAVPAGGW